MVTVYLGMGSNVGDRIVHIRTALASLRKAEQGGQPVLRNLVSSSLYENPAWMPEGAPEDWNRPFLNLVVRAETDCSPEALLAITQQAEEAAGRIRRGVWGPREMDIDILLYGDQRYQAEKLTIPHPGLKERPFVLVPLAELNPDLPLDGQTPAQRLQGLDTRMVERFCAPLSPMTSRGDRG